MGSSEAGKVLTIPALGRPFGLGMLYDCRSDELLCGMTLWEEDILKYKREQRHDSNDVAVLCSDSFDKKAAALDVSGSLRLSLLGGLLSLDGSAKYLDDRKSSSQQQRVILQYKCTTRVDSLTMTQLGEGRVQHPAVFDHGTATHVVTSVTYGAQAFFIFDGHCEDSSSDFELSADGRLGAEGNKTAEGFLESVVRKIPGMKYDGGGKVKWTENEENKLKKFTCRFYGDFMLPQNPSSYEDAVTLYETLPKLLGERGENAVPVKVQLYPLSQIDAKASKLVRDISIYLINGTEKFFEEMHGFDIKCNDLLKFEATNRFIAIRHQIEDFRNLTETYRGIIQKDFRELLPRVRGGDGNETSIAELLNKISMSPFSRDSLRSWLETKETDIKVLNEFTRTLSDIRFATEPGDLRSAVMSPHAKHCLCLIFSLPSCASQPEAMRKYCLGTNITSPNEKAGTMSVAQDVGSKLSMQEVTCVFKDFYNANKANKAVSFIVAQEFSECSALCARIEYYKNGERKSSNYELPSAPEKVEALVGDATHDSLTINWRPPQYGASAIMSYVVSCIQNATQQVTSSLTVSHEHNRVTITGLAANTEYKVRVCGTLEVGQSPFGEAEVVMRTKPASPPEILRIQKASPTEVLLMWRAPACLAAECGVEHYVIKQETSPGHWEEKVCTSSNELTCKVKVEPSGVHVFKVSGFCGSVGHTCDSKSVTVDFTHLDARQDLKHDICANSSVVPSSPYIYVPKMRVITADHENIMLEVGDRQPRMPEKVILLLGETGSGVNTLIDAIANYIFGVRWEDSFRFRVTWHPVASQTETQTTSITSYTIHHHEGCLVPYSITLVQIPDFGANELKNKKISEKMDSFFATAGITHLDAVGLVVSASVSTLTPCQAFVFDEILSLFGEDIADNIFLLFPFSDGSEPQILGALERANIPFKKYFKLNNSALCARWSTDCRGAGSGSDEDRLKMASLLWEMGVKSLRLFLEELNFVERKSLSLTREVLSERVKLEAILGSLNHHTGRMSCAKLDDVKRSLQRFQEIALKPNPVSRLRIFYKLIMTCRRTAPSPLDLTISILAVMNAVASVAREMELLRVREKVRECLMILDEENIDEDMVHFLVGCGRQILFSDFHEFAGPHMS